MLEREARNKYLLEFGGAIGLYLVVLFISLSFAKSMEPGKSQTLLLLAPVLPVMLAVWAIARQFRRMDEFVRLRGLESIAIGAAVTAGVTFTYGFLELAGFPKLSMFCVLPLFAFVWGGHAALRCLLAR